MHGKGSHLNLIQGFEITWLMHFLNFFSQPCNLYFSSLIYLFLFVLACLLTLLARGGSIPSTLVCKRETICLLFCVRVPFHILCCQKCKVKSRVCAFTAVSVLLSLVGQKHLADRHSPALSRNPFAPLSNFYHNSSYFCSLKLPP